MEPTIKTYRDYPSDPFFQLSDLPEEHFRDLKQNILEHGGCISPLVAWLEGGVLIDGRHRVKAVEEILGEGGTASAPEVLLKSFPCREAALLWVIQHQNGKRPGWSTFEKVKRLESSALKDYLAAEADKRMKSGTVADPRTTLPEGLETVEVTKGRARDIKAELVGVSAGTYHKWVAVLADPLLTKAVEDGIVTPNQAYTGLKSYQRREQENIRAADAVKVIPTYEGGASGLLNKCTWIDGLLGLRKLADASVDLIFTSIPYPLTAVLYPTAEPFYNGIYQDYLNKLALYWIECRRVLKPGGRLVINGDNCCVPMEERDQNGGVIRFDTRSDIAGQLKPLGFLYSDEPVWAKQNAVGTRPAMGSKGSPIMVRIGNNCEWVAVYSNQKYGIEPQDDSLNDLTSEEQFKWTMQLWEIPPASRPTLDPLAEGEGAGHRCAFPEELVRRIVKLYTYRGQVVLDMFGGSMTVPAVAAELGRQFIGFDASEQYVKDGQKRVEASIARARALSADPPPPIPAKPITIKGLKNTAKFRAHNNVTRKKTGEKKPSTELPTETPEDSQPE